MTTLPHRLGSILSLPAGERIEPLLALSAELAEAETVALNGLAGKARDALLELVEGDQGTGRQRAQLGALLGKVGDPRLRTPDDPAYWVTLTREDGTTLEVGRYHVTTAEFRAWAASGVFEDRSAWSEGGWAWLQSGPHAWAQLAAAPDVAHLTVDNQPVAGATWWEAEAYAAAHGSRLLTVQEHRFAVRGAEKRPYPWGAPFVEGSANTREEALGRPCAVGLYRRDVTPEGICDLAGNMGEWLADTAGDKRIIHPGSWARPSMATWAKAIEIVGPAERSADLGFRLARG